MLPQDKKLMTVREAIKNSYAEYRAALLRLIADEMLKMDIQKGATTGNLLIKERILSKIRSVSEKWIHDHGAPEMWRLHPDAAIPDTTLGQAVNFGIWYAENNSGYMSPNRDMLMIENLQKSVNHVSSVASQDYDRLRTILTQRLITPAEPGTDPYRDTMRQLEEEFLLRPNVAETVFRGTVMETIRLAHAGGWTEDTLLQHTGPEPRPMPNGHEFCIDHYGEIHTLGEWRDLAVDYDGQGGTDPDHIVEFCGGYNCRHTFREIHAANIEDYHDSVDMYKSMQQSYLEHIASDEYKFYERN